MLLKLRSCNEEVIKIKVWCAIPWCFCTRCHVALWKLMIRSYWIERHKDFLSFEEISQRRLNKFSCCQVCIYFMYRHSFTCAILICSGYSHGNRDSSHRAKVSGAVTLTVQNQRLKLTLLKQTKVAWVFSSLGVVKPNWSAIGQNTCDRSGKGAVYDFVLTLWQCFKGRFNTGYWAVVILTYQIKLF